MNLDLMIISVNTLKKHFPQHQHFSDDAAIFIINQKILPTIAKLNNT